MLKFLASPFSHQSRIVQRARYEEICRVAATLISRGNTVFSPIAHRYGISLLGDIDIDREQFAGLSEAILLRSDFLWVVTMDGWEQSQGIRQKIAIAERESIPVLHLDPNSFELTKPQDAIAGEGGRHEVV